MLIALIIACLAQIPLVTSSEWDIWYQSELATRISYCLDHPRTTTYHFSPSGSDATGDGSETLPYATMDKAQQLINSTSPGQAIALRFQRGGVWRELVGFDDRMKSVAFDAYGDGDKPVFTPFKILPEGTTDENGVYVVPMSETVTWVIDPAPMIRGNSYTYVQAMDGSWWFDGNSSPRKLYINPRASSTTFEYTQPTDAGVILRGDRSFVRGLVFKGWGMRTTTPSQQHGIEIRATDDDQCLVIDSDSDMGSSHVMVTNATTNGWGNQNPGGGVATFVNCTAGGTTFNGGPNETIFNTYALQGGQDVIFDTCTVTYGTLPSSDWNFTGPRRGTGFYGHTAGPQVPFGRVIMKNCIVNDTEQPSNFSDLPAATSLSQVKGFIVGEQFSGAFTGLATTGLVRTRGTYTLYPWPLSYAAGNYAQSGWCINNDITLNLSRQQWEWALFNALPNTPVSPRYWFNTFRITGKQPTTTFRLDYDVPTQGAAGSFVNNVIDNRVGVPVVLNLGGINNNAYYNCANTAADTAAVLLSAPPTLDCDSPLNCAAVPIPDTDTDNSGPSLLRNTIGANEIRGCADFNGDGEINFFDYLDFADAFSLGAASADMNSDFEINFFDYLDFVDLYSLGCL